MVVEFVGRTCHLGKKTKQDKLRKNSAELVVFLTYKAIWAYGRNTQTSKLRQFTRIEALLRKIL